MNNFDTEIIHTAYPFIIPSKPTGYYMHHLINSMEFSPSWDAANFAAT
jgi:hypothetical protein